MYQIIAPTLFQNKICKLPGIGTLVMVSNPAETDFVNGQIKSPFETIQFVAAPPEENIFNEFSAISELLKKNLIENGSFFLHGIGTFFNSKENEVSFSQVLIDTVFTMPIDVERVIRQDATHAMLVGDQQTTNVEMTEYFTEQVPPTDRWWVWALVLSVIGIAAILLYLYLNANHSMGNVGHF
jgi:hypothetical protein